MTEEKNSAQTPGELRDTLEGLMVFAKNEQNKMPSWASVQIGLFMVMANALVLIAESTEATAQGVQTVDDTVERVLKEMP